VQSPAGAHAISLVTRIHGSGQLAMHGFVALAVTRVPQMLVAAAVVKLVLPGQTAVKVLL
jgi:hypothetical protein